MTLKSKDTAMHFDSGRGEYRNKKNEIVEQNNSRKSPDVSNEGNNDLVKNSRDRYENAEPFIGDNKNPVTKKIAESSDINLQS